MDIPPTLGWVGSFEPWEVTREHFPSKVGGFPAWLSLNLPSQHELLCNECGNILTFCLQLYAPDDRHDHAFHRSLYFFICQPCGNNFAIFRNQLPRDNEFFGYNPLEPGITIDSSKEIQDCCNECGLPCESSKSDNKLNGNKMNGDTISNSNSSIHKRCDIARIHKTLKPTFSEYVINIAEIDDMNNDYSYENQLYQKYLTNSNNSISDEDGKMIGKSRDGDSKNENENENYEETYDTIEEQKYNLLGNDTSYDLFCQITGHQDVIYYDRHGNPLWVSNRNKKLGDDVINWEPPKCNNCGGDRTFEFQILPQLLHYLDNERLDFSSIAIYTCSNSCPTQGYVREFVRPEFESRIKINGSWKGIC